MYGGGSHKLSTTDYATLSSVEAPSLQPPTQQQQQTVSLSQAALTLAEGAQDDLNSLLF